MRSAAPGFRRRLAAVRSSADMTSTRVGRPRRRIIILVVVAALVILALSLRSLAGLYADSLWYSSIHQHEVFSTILTTKIGLFLVFGLIFFLAMWGNLLLCNRLGPSELFLDAPEDELVRRFQSAVRPYAGRLYALLSFVLALIAASSAVGRWQQWILFSNSKPFHVRDPLFNLDLSWYIFRLPFLTFVVDWTLASLLAIIIFTAVFHYLNGGIRAARVTPRVTRGVKVHLSVLLALLALAKAAGYLIARWHLVTSTSNGIVEGAGYADVHYRLPALLLLFWICVLAALILIVNIFWQRGWTLPVIAIGLWAFVALLIGVIYPAILQAVKVTPAQSQLELPYIARNIAATRAAYNLSNVSVSDFAASSTKPLLEQPGVTATLADIRQWDPDPQIAQATFQQIENQRNYYSVSGLGEDRYMIDGKLTPIVEGLRELNTSGISNATWVNVHLQYTHGLGIVMIPANENQTSTGKPVFAEGNVPPKASDGFPAVTEPGVYFGLSQSGFVVVDTKQHELNYDNHGTPVYSAYEPCPASASPSCQSGGAVPIGGFFRRLMFAIHFGDPNLLLSSLIKPESKIVYMRNVVQIAQHAAPFLSIDDHPYAAIIGGHIDWILDGYTSTDQYPYSQNASTQLIPSDTGLPSSYNYVRNSVKIVIDAYTGQVTLYAIDKQDPILKAWMSAFPGLIHPMFDMSPQLQAHLKYPEDIFSIQAAIYGRYHITKPSAFYNNGDGWSLSPTDGAGSPSNTIQLSTEVARNGAVISQTVARMDPLYQVYALPGSKAPQYTLTDAYVAASSANQTSSTTTPSSGVLNLTAFMVALSDPKDYGKFVVYRAPVGPPTPGPVLADSAMSSYPPASTKISYLDQHGSNVLLGNVLMVPIDGSMLYVRPMYVSSVNTDQPLLNYFIAVYKQRRGFAPTLAGALSQVFGTASQSSSSPTHQLTTDELIALALAEAQRASEALTAGGPNPLGLYQHYTNLENRYLEEAYSQSKGTSTSTTTTTTTTPTRKT
jgi:uncharacterized protein